MHIFFRSGYLHAFMIPPDFDDTFVNIGLGALLSEMKEDFPDTHAQWMSQNTNLTSVYDALKKYAYRPMSNKSAINSIDCRTYFYLRFFLEDAMNKKEDIALVPTWVSYSKTCVKRPLSNKTKQGFSRRLIAGQKYCRMLQFLQLSLSPSFCLFLSDCFTQGLLCNYIMAKPVT